MFNNYIPFILIVISALAAINTDSENTTPRVNSTVSKYTNIGTATNQIPWSNNINNKTHSNNTTSLTNENVNTQSVFINGVIKLTNQIQLSNISLTNSKPSPRKLHVTRSNISKVVNITIQARNIINGEISEVVSTNKTNNYVVNTIRNTTRTTHSFKFANITINLNDISPNVSVNDDQGTMVLKVRTAELSTIRLQTTAHVISQIVSIISGSLVGVMTQNVITSQIPGSITANRTTNSVEVVPSWSTSIYSGSDVLKTSSLSVFDSLVSTIVNREETSMAIHVPLIHYNSIRTSQTKWKNSAEVSQSFSNKVMFA